MGQAGSIRPDRDVYRRLFAALLGGLLLIGSAPSEAQSPVKQVLVLQSLTRGNLQIDEFTGDFRVMLDQRSGKPVNVVQLVVGAMGFVGAPERAAVDYIRSIYANHRPPDLIITVSGPAAVFARKYRRDLFPETPLLLTAVDRRWFGGAALGENETAVAVDNDFPRLIDDILRVLPNTRQIFVVIGAGPIGQFWHRQLEAELAPFRGRLTFAWSDTLSLADIVRRVATLPTNSAIVYLTFSTDGLGGAYADAQVLTDIHAKASAPMFGSQSPYIGRGVVGGSMLSIDDLALRTADVASRILNGEQPSTLRVPLQLPGQRIFDWRELQRWNISESRLPPGSIVRYRPPSLWEGHKVAVLMAIAAVALEACLIALLLYERRARQRAEIESRRNLELAVDANRRETVAALTSSIGHELAQPLTAIFSNAETLELLMTTKRTSADMTEEIVGDIKREARLATDILDRHRAMLRSHQLRKQPIDVQTVIDETIALVAYELRSRRIELILDLSSSPCVVHGDQVLLEQVLVNLVRNAVDALTDTPPGTRRITIRSLIKDTDVEISVHDSGTGLSPEIIDKLFTPFVTTKSHGLGIGLIIAQRIVQAHSGAIWARENADGGATFTVRLPCSLTPSSVRAGQAWKSIIADTRRADPASHDRQRSDDRDSPRASPHHR